MSKLSKIIIASVAMPLASFAIRSESFRAIAATAAGTIYFTSASGDKNTAKNNNKAVANETSSQATLVSPKAIVLNVK